jgi:hypothetical protein
MRKIKVLGVAVIALVALSAVAASSAFALESVWLVNGAKPTAAVATDSTGANFLLEDTKSADIVCATVTDEGNVGPGAADKTTAVVFNNCVASGAACTVTPLFLPWETKVELVGGVFKDKVTKAGYKSECTILGIKVTDECKKEGGFIELSNLGTNVDANFLATEEGTCTTGGIGLAVGLEEVLTVSGVSLAVSEA